MVTDALRGVDVQIEGSDDEDVSLEWLSAARRAIHTDSSDPQIESLHGKWKRGRLNLQPFFQRQFVWDHVKASRLIESALLGIPLPVIYLAQEADGRESVVDGQQRLTAFFSFLDGRFPNGDPFRLSGLKVFPELNRNSFQELDETQQDRIRYCHIRAITILQDSDPDLKFEIFERLNSGSVPLNDMELRNCVYHGHYIELLKELANDSDFKQLIGFKGPDIRMRDVELVLRFAAFFHATYLHYRVPMKKFLNNDMRLYRNISEEDSDRLRRNFKNAVQIIRSLFGDSAFRRFNRGTQFNPNGYWETKRFNASLYDVLMGVFCDRDKNQIYAAMDRLREGLIDLMATNGEFIEAILQGTSHQQKVVRRFDLARLLVEDILASQPHQPRCFSRQLKEQLFAANPTCAICHQHIEQIDDAAVDHMIQYWRGGQTIPENARLAHRYCNLARPRND